MSAPSSERPGRGRRVPIGLADAPLGDYGPASSGPAPTPTARAVDPRTEPARLARDATQSVNFHIPRALDRRLARLKYELESEYGVRTSKTALTAAALYALPADPLEVVALLRAYEAAELPLEPPR